MSARAHRQHLLLATAERAGDLAAALLETREHLVRARDAVVDVLLRHRIAAHLQVLFDGQAGKGASPFGHLDHAEPDDLVRRHGFEVLAVEPDGTRPWPQDAADRVEGGRLTRAVAPMSVTTSPCSTARETPFRAWMLP
jgi:hypothetical protein